MNWLLSLFFALTPLDIARRELRISKTHLMGVENDLEMFIAHKELLVRRIARLEKFMDDSVQVHPSLNEIRQGFEVNHAV